ncbi:MAG TPA: DMT family transporter [Acidimicrobiales bacterium]|nr:DMT family transporter [Acidimicrobiales bacterium]
MRGTLRADLALAGAAFLFGTTFLVMQDAVADVEPIPFIAARFAVGALVLLPAAVVRGRGAPPRPLLLAGASAAVALAAGYVFQTTGLQYTTSSVSAFLTYLLVVFVPLLSALVLRRPPRSATAVGVVLAVVGLWLLTEGAGIGLGRGEVLSILCALAFAIHILVLSEVATRHDVVVLNALQFGLVALALFVPGLLAGGYAFPASAWWAAVYTGVVVNALAFGLQLYGQRRVSASRTALVLMLEPVFAAILGYVDGERIGAAGALGAGLILGGILVSEWGQASLDQTVNIEGG